MGEIAVCRQHDQTVLDAGLREQCINGSDLDTAAAALVMEVSRVDIVLPRGSNHGDLCESFDDLRPGLRSAKALQ